MIDFHPFPNLSTERLLLRQMNLGDAKEIFVLRSDEGVREFIDIPKATSIDDAEQFITRIINAIELNESIMWAITMKGNNQLLGTICLWNIDKENMIADIGYMLDPGWQGKGIMQEAFVKVVDYGFETMQLNVIEADVDANNIKSVNILERNGFGMTKSSEKTVIYSKKSKR